MSRRKILFLLTVAAMSMPLAYYLHATKPVDDLQLAVVRIGFHPLVPPNKLRVPGSFYYTDLGGWNLRPVCEADDDIVRPYLKTSAIPTQEQARLLKAHVTIAGKLLSAINANFGAETVEAVEFSFKEISIYELDGSGLSEIQDKLVELEHCNRAIENWIDDVGLVCQIQSALLATVKYVAKRKSGTTITEEADLKKFKEGLEKSGVEQAVLGDQTIEGIALFYGIKFKPKCMVKQSDTGALIFPETALDRGVLYLKLLYRRWLP